MMSTIDADEAWCPPTFTPLVLGRPRLAASTIAADSQRTRRETWRSTSTPESVPWAASVAVSATMGVAVMPCSSDAGCVALMVHYPAPVEDNAIDLSAAIGARVRSERQAREWTLDQLAEKSSVSRRMLINVEQGTANPSVMTLLRLSDALGIDLQALVAVPRTKPVEVVRANTAPALWTGERGGRGVLLAGTTPPDILELWDWTLAPGDRHDSEAHVRGTKEIVQVREGTLAVTVGDQTEVLEVDDAISFASDVAHSCANEGDGPARFSLTVFEPGLGAARAPWRGHLRACPCGPTQRQLTPSGFHAGAAPTPVGSGVEPQPGPVEHPQEAVAPPLAVVGAVERPAGEVDAGRGERFRREGQRTLAHHPQLGALGRPTG